jgi:hypothetical protein
MEHRPSGAFDLFSLLKNLRQRRYAVPAGKHRFNWHGDAIGSVAEQVLCGCIPDDLVLERINSREFDRESCDPIYGQVLGEPKFRVVQGHVRLTAINYAFAAPDLPPPNILGQIEEGKRGRWRLLYFLRTPAFLESQENSGVNWVPVSHGGGDGYAGAAIYFGAEERQYHDHIFPLSVLDCGAAKLKDWLAGYVTYWKEMHSTFPERFDRRGMSMLRIALEFHRKLESTIVKFRRGHVE